MENNKEMPLREYLNQRLQELEKEHDMYDLKWKGKLSFGISSHEYGHLPAWNELVRQKKQMKRMFWFNAFFISLFAVLIVGDVADKVAEKSWWLMIIYVLVMTAFLMLIDVVWSFHSMFYHFRRTEREVRKLIYQDLLNRVEQQGGDAQRKTA